MSHNSYKLGTVYPGSEFFRVPVRKNFRHKCGYWYWQEKIFGYRCFTGTGREKFLVTIDHYFSSMEKNYQYWNLQGVD